jgi:protein-L-isoaspartate(D-aspartate) O-methyltransferase
MTKESLLIELRKKGVSVEILQAFAVVKREDFVPEEFILHAYDDVPIPLSERESSLSQPSTIAFMLQLLDPSSESKVIEIGSGSGYVLALLAELCPKATVYGVEINTKLAINSTKKLSQNPRITIFNTDGSNGLLPQAPFNRILMSAASPDLGTVYSLIDQLSDPGILVAPVKDSLVQIIKKDKKIEKHEFPGFSFVKLIKN